MAVTYCAGHDPAVMAGYLTCRDCQGRAYPLDAAWVTSQLIMVSYGPVLGDPECPGSHGARLVLLDGAAADQLVPVAPAGNADRASAHYGERMFCIATTGYGTLCGNRAKADGLCGVHLAQRARRVRQGGCT